jgi:3',5'-cyclic AMP phosphodiesterase CpdA
VRTILHVSDVHFGPPHLPRLSEGVIDLVEERRPDLVVVSGDLTQRALPEQFRQARAWVDRIPAPTLVVPGNHDIPFHKPLFRLWRRFLEPFGEYKRHFSPDLEPVYSDPELVVAGVNTAHGWTIKDGTLRRRRLREVAEIFRHAPPAAYRVVVAHHQLVPAPGFGSQTVSRNAEEAITVFARSGVGLVLSGHLHQGYVASSEAFYPQAGAPVLLLHSGTSTSSRGRAHERERNTCNWIKIDAGSVTISALLWQPVPGAFVIQSRHWYPRQPAPVEGSASDSTRSEETPTRAEPRARE